MRAAGPCRGSMSGKRNRTVGSAPAISISCSRSSCLALLRAWLAVLALARFLAMNVSSCRRLVSVVAFTRRSCSRRSSTIGQVRVDVAGEHRELAARQLERVRAGALEERAIVRDDQAAAVEAAQEMLEQHLRAQVEEVRRLVEDQQVRVVQQQGGQLDARLPAAGELAHGPVEHGVGKLKLPGDLAALPVGLAAVAHQEVEDRLARHETDRAAAGSRAAACRLRTTSPASSSSSPRSMRQSVLLPAPLRPMRPTFWSSVSAQLAPSSSTWSP